VRREKELVDCGWKFHPWTWFALPGSKRRGGGGNETVGASGVGRPGRPARGRGP